MKFFFPLLFIQISLAQTTPTPDAEAWRLGQRYYLFSIDKESRARVSIDCLKKKDSCEAYKAVTNKAKIVLSEEERSGGKNPGAVICKKNYGGEILILRDSANNENAFCKFKDNSIVSTGDLF